VKQAKQAKSRRSLVMKKPINEVSFMGFCAFERTPQAGRTKLKLLDKFLFI